MDQSTGLVVLTLISSKGDLGKYVPTASTSEFNNFRDWMNEVWHSGQGRLLQVPPTIPASKAAEMVSIILEYKAKNKLGGTVEIKKVAEIRGSRFNSGKPRFDLIDGLAMEGLAQVLTKGAIKYAAHNWRAGMPYMEVIASLERHIAKLKQGEDIDKETGEYHADHIQCNAMFLSNMMKTRPDMDDRVATQMNLRGTQQLTPKEYLTKKLAENSSQDASS